MNPVNPYQAPESTLIAAHDISTLEPASRLRRWGGAMLDRIAFLFFSGPVLYAFGSTDYTNRGQSLPFPLAFSQTAIDFLIFALLNGYLLKRYGQTIGKKIVGTRIVSLDDRQPALPLLLGFRYLPVYCIGLLALLSYLPGIEHVLSDASRKLYYAQFVLLMLDSLFIFRNDRRCIHDLIAGTKVVRVQKKEQSQI